MKHFQHSRISCLMRPCFGAPRQGSIHGETAQLDRMSVRADGSAPRTYELTEVENGPEVYRTGWIPEV